MSQRRYVKVSIALTPKLVDLLDVDADIQDRSRSYIIRKILTRHYNIIEKKEVV